MDDTKKDYLRSIGLEEQAIKSLGSQYEELVYGYEISGLGTGEGRSRRESSGNGLEGEVRSAMVAVPEIKLLYSAVTKLKPSLPREHRDMVFCAIGDGRIWTTPQLEEARFFLEKVNAMSGAQANNLPSSDVTRISESEFEAAIGVGVLITEADVEKVLDHQIDENRESIVNQRYNFNVGLHLVRPAMAKLRFADGGIVKKKAAEKVEMLLGPKTAEDLAPARRTRGTISEVQTPAKKQTEIEVEEDHFAGIPGTMVARDLASSRNSSALIEQQKKNSEGRIVCRFPPEPNGYLHIGHAKALYMDFGYARKMNGVTILRFDDTNPSKEKEEFIESIKEVVAWMGYKPYKVTFSSDYFDQLHEFAIRLIKEGKAYVCHQKSEEMKKGREKKTESPWRNRPMEENLQLFQDMRMAKFGEGEAVLRLKIDMQSLNPNLQDPVAYRIIYAHHPHVGDKWCIYPTYDYTHCIVDSLEWVTHSLCTLEFEVRRDLYYWILEALDLYRPFVWEFARLTLERTIVSKRSLAKLVELGIVRSWDDPRMPTLTGLRRKGYTPSAITKFCSVVGVKRSDNTRIGLHLLEHCVRADLDVQAPRGMAVLKPLRVFIENFPADAASIPLKISNHPKNATMGDHDMVFTPVVYIDRSDFRVKDEPGYFGLAPNKSALLRHAFPVTVKEVVFSSSGEPEELRATYDPKKSIKPKGVLHWVPSEPFSEIITVRMYEPLFQSDEPGSDFLNNINPNSLVEIADARADSFVAHAKPGDSFQFERCGYFCCDPDSTDTRRVFNLTVPLRDSYG